MFEGSKNVAPGDYDRLSLQAGCENNAYTTEDKTNYYLLVPAHQLEFGLWLESDRMLEFSTTEESLDIQKGVVIEEKKQVFDNRPYGTVSLELSPLLFEDNCYGWDVIGEEKDIENAELKDIKDFFEHFYVPQNAVLTVSGCFDTDKTIELVRKYFGTVKKGQHKINRVTFTDKPIEKDIIKTIHDDVQLPGIFGAYKIPEENSREFYAFDILTDILSTGESSRLYNELVYKKQMVSDIGCWVEGRELAGLLHFYAILMPGIKIEDVQTEIDNIIRSAAMGSITAKELEKVKNRIETRHAYRMQTNLSKADLLTHYKIFYDNPGMINSYTDNYRNITIKDIAEASEKYLLNSGRVILNYIPRK
jgi:predicted Zn-dependent peptidase